jgi:outer membrane protein assembly factor BamB
VTVGLLRRLRRKIFGYPRIWNSPYSRFAAAEVDDGGFLCAFVYAGSERSSFRHWVRRWERDRGVAWEHRCKRKNWDALPVRNGAVVFATPDRRLTAVDLRTGALRWSRPFELSLDEDVRDVDGALLYLGEDGEWVCVDPADGTIRDRGRLRAKSEKDERLRLSRPAVSYLHGSGIGTSEVMARWPEAEAKVFLAAVYALCEQRYHCKRARLESCLLAVDPVTKTATLVIVNEEAYGRHDVLLVIVNPFTGDELWRLRLGANAVAARLEVAHDLGGVVAVHMHALAGPVGRSYVSVTFMVDLARRRVLGELSAELGSWVAVPDGRRRAIVV